MRSIKALMDLRGRVALVTGGGGHIGAVICDALAELGANIVVADIDEKTCNTVSENIMELHAVEAFSLTIDLADENVVKSVPLKVLDYFGRLDILVNCAAFVGTSDLEGWVSPVQEQSSCTWRKALEVNLTVPFVLTQACAEALASSGNGSVINIASIYGVVGPDMGLYVDTDMGSPAAYAASKGGVLQLTRWLATVLAPEIRVNAVSPGGVWRDQSVTFRERYTEKTPLRRMATEEDIKGAVVYLASDLSAYVTGHNLVVDGGWIIW